MTLKKTAAVFVLGAAIAGSVVSVADAKGMGHGGMMPEMNFEAIDADKNGKITPEEFDAFRAAEFAKADTNGDGLLNADELAAKHLADITARAAEMSAGMIDRMDENGDGQLSAEELAKGPRAPTIFERIDANEDGEISQDEVDAAKDRMGEMRGKHGMFGGHGMFGKRGHDNN